MKKATDIKTGMEFRTEIEGVVRNFRVVGVTPNKITVINLASYAHKINVNTMTCHAFGMKQVQRILDTNGWIF